MAKPTRNKPLKKTADFRTCARCEWVFRLSEPLPKTSEWSQGACPQCGFASYGARWVYGVRAYRFAITQKPWFDKKTADAQSKLWEIIDNSPAAIKSRRPRVHQLNIGPPA